MSKFNRTEIAHTGNIPKGMSIIRDTHSMRVLKKENVVVEGINGQEEVISEVNASSKSSQTVGPSLSSDVVSQRVLIGADVGRFLSARSLLDARRSFRFMISLAARLNLRSHTEGRMSS
jgi:hypothetical protein